VSNFKNELIDLMGKCIVKITVSKGNKVGSTGTGFFVAPRLIMTCAHVVKEAKNNKELSINIHIEGQNHTVSVNEGNFFEEADVCLLRTDISSDFCVYLEESMEVGDDLYAYGYPVDLKGNSFGDSLTLEYEGNDEQTLAKLKGGQVQPGFSGSPLLNLRTGNVCGVLKRTRDRNTDLGGRAIPVTEIFRLISELKQAQRDFHKNDKTWKKLASKLQKENKQDKSMAKTIINQQRQTVNSPQYNAGGTITINHNSNSSEKSNKTLHLAIIGAVVLVIIVGIIAMVALKPTVSNITTGDGSKGVVHTGDGNVTISSDKENE